MQHLIFLSFQYRKYSNCYIIALQYFLKYGSAIIQQLLHLIFLFLQVEHIAIAILLHCNILIILQCNNIAIAIFSISSFKLQFYRKVKMKPLERDQKQPGITILLPQVNMSQTLKRGWKKMKKKRGKEKSQSSSVSLQ